jgi:glycosyltransferase involved in cell wall biosynthesis
VTDLSVVIPVYNEEASLSPLWSELRGVLERLGLAFEVVFVDDGSRDRSAEIIRSFRESDQRVRLVRLKTNGGETAATDAGFKAARGRRVVVMDADLQNDPSDIPMLLSYLDQWDAVTPATTSCAAPRRGSRIAFGTGCPTRRSRTAAVRSGRFGGSACAGWCSTGASTGSSPRSSRCAGIA